MSRFLFLDDRHVARTAGPERRPHRARRHAANPLLTREQPWEQSRVQIYGRSVIFDPAVKTFRMYYIAQAGPTPHPWNRLNDRDLPGHTTLPAYAESRDGMHGIGLATWRRDGFVSLRADRSGGELLTTGFTPVGRELHLNLEAPAGEVRVQVCDHQGVPMEDAPEAVLREVDSTDVIAPWRNGALSPFLGQLLSLRISLRNANLYSFWTQ